MQCCRAFAFLFVSLDPFALVAQVPLEMARAAVLRVLDCNGGPVVNCRVTLLHTSRQHPGFSLRDRDRDPGPWELVPRDFEVDRTVLTGLFPGEFVFQIEDGVHAVTRSPVFTIADGEAAPEVEVRLTRGARLLGTVRDAEGKPVAAATVRTEAYDEAWGASILSIPVERSETVTSVRTNSEGRFMLSRISAGKYWVVIADPGYCRSRVTVEVAGDSRIPLGEVVLQRCAGARQGIRRNSPHGQGQGASGRFSCRENAARTGPLRHRPDRRPGPFRVRPPLAAR